MGAGLKLRVGYEWGMKENAKRCADMCSRLLRVKLWFTKSF